MKLAILKVSSVMLLRTKLVERFARIRNNKHFLNQLIALFVSEYRNGKEAENKERIDAISRSGLFDFDYYQQGLALHGIAIDREKSIYHFEEIGDKLRISPHPLFDNHFYHEEYPDIETSGMSSLFHYIAHGSDENRKPHPLFDSKFVRDQIKTRQDPLLVYLKSVPGKYNPHPLFDEAYVVRQLSDRDEEIQNALISFIGSGEKINPSEQFDCASYREWYPDIKDLNAFYHYVRWGQYEGRTITSGAMSIKNVSIYIDEAASLDPDLIAPNTNIHRIPRVHRIDASSTEEVLLSKLLSAVARDGQKGIFFLPDLALGGAEKVAANVSKAIVNSTAEMRLIIFLTDGSNRECTHWLPKDSRLTVCDIHQEISAVGSLDAAVQVISIYLQLIEPEFLFINNSSVGWHVIEQHGKAIRSFARIIASAFCYDYDQYGRRGGYAWTHLHRSIDFLDKVVTDNRAFVRQISQDLRLTNESIAKFGVLYQPIDMKNVSYTASADSSKSSITSSSTVLWASRFARQKRVLLALEVARMLPDVNFVFAGGAQSELQDFTGAIPSNVSFVGRYNNFSDLLCLRSSVFLYTSEFDGIPNVLLEAASAGMSIVAPKVGGIEELVTEETGWLVVDHNSPHSYSEAIHSILSNYQEAAFRKNAMSSLLNERHSFARFTHSVCKLLSTNSDF